MFCVWWFTSVFNTAMIGKEVVIVTIISEIGAKWEQIENCCENFLFFQNL